MTSTVKKKDEIIKFYVQLLNVNFLIKNIFCYKIIYILIKKSLIVIKLHSSNKTIVKLHHKMLVSTNQLFWGCHGLPKYLAREPFEVD